METQLGEQYHRSESHQANGTLRAAKGGFMFAAMPVKMKGVADRIAQGIRTSANEVAGLGSASTDAIT
jgi:hypothetical protein